MIGIIGAMNIEVEGILAMMEDIKTQNIAGTVFHIGYLNNTQVVAATCGIGKVNAAMCAQAMICMFSPKAIINSGVAGGMHESLNIGDIVISDELVQHDVNVLEFGYERGKVPGLDTKFFSADDTLVKQAKNICDDIFANSTKSAYIGRIASGDQFISSAAQKSHIQELFGAYAVEMEGAAIAHVCHLNNIPFVVIRSISDKADGSADVDFGQFVGEAAEVSIKAVTALVSKLNQSGVI